VAVYWPWEITVFAISEKGVLTGSEMGQTQTFWYVDNSVSGLVDIDSTAIYVDFHQLQKLCWMDGREGSPPRVNEIRIKLSDGIALESGRDDLARQWRQFARDKDTLPQARLLRDVTVQTWQQFRRSNIAPMEKEKSMMIVVFAMIGLVAIFIVFAIFYMIVTEKIKDLGIIKSVGGSSWAVSRIFLGFGVLIGLIGSLLGTTLGYLIVVNSNRIEGWLFSMFGFRLWPPELYAIEKIPDVVRFPEAAVIVTIAVLASVAGAALPAWRAARLLAVEALRVE